MGLFTDEDVAGLIVTRKSEGVDTVLEGTYEGTPPTTANKFAIGCVIQDITNGIFYVNRGTLAVPVWGSQDLTVKVSLTNAQIKAMRATPVELIPALGAGILVVVQSVTLELNAGANVLTESTDNMVVQYSDGQDITGAIEATGFIDQAANTWALYYPANVAAGATATVGVNKAVELFNTGDGEYAGNAAADATLDAWVTYHIFNLATS